MTIMVSVGLGMTLTVAARALSGVPVHAGAPFWTERDATEHVMIGRIETNGRLVRLEDTLCLGTGLRVRSRGAVKYQHFNCLLTPARERRFWIRLHTLRSGWSYAFLHWA